MEENQHKVDWHISSKEAFTHYLTASYPVSLLSTANIWEILLRKNTHCAGKYVKLVRPGILRTCVENKIHWTIHVFWTIRWYSITTSSFLRREHIFPTVWFWGPNPHGVTGSWRRLERYNHSYVTDYDAEEAEGCCCCCCWGSCRGAPSLLLTNGYIVSQISWNNSNPSLLLEFRVVQLSPLPQECTKLLLCCIIAHFRKWKQRK